MCVFEYGYMVEYGDVSIFEVLEWGLVVGRGWVLTYRSLAIFILYPQPTPMCILLPRGSVPYLIVLLPYLYICVRRCVHRCVPAAVFTESSLKYSD